MAAAEKPTFYLCIDCGGTKTAAALATPNGEIVAQALGGPSNFSYVGLDAFLIAISTAVNTALAHALSLPPPTTFSPSAGIIGAGTYTIAAAWLGVSGVDSAASVAQLTPAISSLLNIPAGPRLAITNDVHLLGAPLATLPNTSSAVAVIGGTGAIVVSFVEGEKSVSEASPLQEVARVGGWGWILGDEGGGFDVGRTALRFLLQQRDEQSAGVQPTPSTPGPLLSSILKRFKINDLLEVLSAVHVPDPVAGTAAKGAEDEYDYTAFPREKRLSALSPLVFRAAYEDGDELALAILKDCARRLADQICTVLASPNGSEPEVRRFVFTGLHRLIMVCLVFVDVASSGACSHLRRQLRRFSGRIGFLPRARAGKPQTARPRLQAHRDRSGSCARRRQRSCRHLGKGVVVINHRSVYTCSVCWI